jgi:hypothetical protein
MRKAGQALLNGHTGTTIAHQPPATVFRFVPDGNDSIPVRDVHPSIPPLLSSVEIPLCAVGPFWKGCRLRFTQLPQSPG